MKAAIRVLSANFLDGFQTMSFIMTPHCLILVEGYRVQGAVSRDETRVQGTGFRVRRGRTHPSFPWPLNPVP
jgi:hypothetical protein